MMDFHENWSRQDQVEASSDRTLGLVFSGFFAIVALLPLLRHHPMRLWAFVPSVLFFLAALAAPKLLSPLNRAWTALAILLHRVTNPIILGVFFYAVITPFGWLFRLMGKDRLALKPAPEKESFWIMRQPPGPAPETMSNQF